MPHETLFHIYSEIKELESDLSFLRKSSWLINAYFLVLVYRQDICASQESFWVLAICSVRFPALYQYFGLAYPGLFVESAGVLCNILSASLRKTHYFIGF